MQWLPRFVLLSLLVSPAALAEQLYRVEMVLSRQASPLLAGQPVPGDQAPGAVRQSGSQRLQRALGEPLAYLSAANGYRIEAGKLTSLGQHGLGMLTGSPAR